MHKVVRAARNRCDNHNSDSRFTQSHNPYATRFPKFALPGPLPSYNRISRESVRGQSRVWRIELERNEAQTGLLPDCVRAAILSHHSSTRSVVLDAVMLCPS